MMGNIEYSYDTQGRRWVFKLEGDVDIYSAPQLKKALNSALEEKVEDVHIECERLDYMDSTGLGVLIGALKRIKEQDRNIYLKELKPNVMKLFNITGLDKIFIVEG
jgi:anti-sigma B factor antagonist